jgi:hypothetical protein
VNDAENGTPWNARIKEDTAELIATDIEIGVALLGEALTQYADGNSDRGSDNFANILTSTRCPPSRRSALG